MSAPRIVSLLPAATELLYALGLGDHLVGRSHECDHPQKARFLPVCSEPAYRVSGHAGDIHQVAGAAGALSMFQLDLDLLRAVQPTHIVTQTRCSVCAVSREELTLKIRDLFESHVEIVDFSPDTLSEYFSAIESLSTQLNRQAEGSKLSRKLQSRVYRIQHKTAKAESAPAIAILEWIEPLIPAGHWNLNFMNIVGSQNVFPNPSGPIQFSQLVESDPDILIIAPCGYSLKKVLTESYLLENRPGWSTLKAVKNNQVYYCDGNHFFNRPGPRLLDTLEILAEIAHPEIFPPKRLFRSYLSSSVLADSELFLSASGWNRSNEKSFIPGQDYYINSEGRHVFTGYYLLNRGYCCKNACLHCPYGFTGPPERR